MYRILRNISLFAANCWHLMTLKLGAIAGGCPYALDLGVFVKSLFTFIYYLFLLPITIRIGN